MARGAKRGPQALSHDRRQARPMQRAGAAPAAAAGARTTTSTRPDAARRGGPGGQARRRAPGLLDEPEPQVGRVMHAIAHAGRPLVGRDGDGLLAWSDRRRNAAGRVLLLRRAAAPELRSSLGLERLDEAEALLDLELAWSRYPSPEDTADVAALLPPDLPDLVGRAPLLKEPRWRRLRLPPPHAAPRP